MEVLVFWLRFSFSPSAAFDDRHLQPWLVWLMGAEIGARVFVE